MKKALIISVSGIGNTILQGPFIRSVLEDGRFEVDCLFGNQGMAQVFKGYPAMNNAFVLPGSFSKSIYLIATLRKRRYDISLSCFPSNRPQFHLLPFLIHDYGKFNAAFSFLSNEKIKAQRGIHDVEQNLRLLVPLEIKRGGDVQKRLYFAISDQDEYEMCNILFQQKKDKLLLKYNTKEYTTPQNKELTEYEIQQIMKQKIFAFLRGKQFPYSLMTEIWEKQK